MSFITGSHAYGKPREPDAATGDAGSDIDLVILMSKREHNLLADLITERGISGGKRDSSLRIGKLNLLVFTEEWKYKAWYKATRYLDAHAQITGKPCSRDMAKEVIDAFEKDDETAAFMLLCEECRLKVTPAMLEPHPADLETFNADSLAQLQSAGQSTHEREPTNGEAQRPT